MMDREAWHAEVHGVAKSWTWLSNWTELNVLIWKNILKIMLAQITKSRKLFDKILPLKL